jgi:dihydropyrimidine dehydrogenase (NAD+) subunit PreA
MTTPFTPDLRSNTAGIRSPNPFWLASAPPTNSALQVQRAFGAGWGGAVWKTIGQPVQNASSRFASLQARGAKTVGFNNIELISEKTPEVNFRDIYETKKLFPHHAVIASLMFETKEEWKEMIARAVDAGADGLELNFGCPHGMCERGMGSTVGQEPQLNETITSWAVEYATIPVLVKLTPNVTDIIPHACAAKRGGAHGISLINTIKSVMGVDIDRMIPLPVVDTRATNGGYCGPAVKPIALHMLGQLAREPSLGLPLSGIGGISNWRDAVEFFLLGASSVQVCTEVMLHGFGVVEDMIEGLTEYMRSKQFHTLDDMRGKAVPAFVEWGALNLNHELVARIDPATCIGCQRCVVACHDGAHQCIHPQSNSRIPIVDESKCVGCNLCQIVCPVDQCISMVAVDNGHPPLTWNEATSGVGAGIGALRPKK